MVELEVVVVVRWLLLVERVVMLVELMRV